MRKIRRPELTVSWRTLASWWEEPGQLSRMGAITAGVARELARAAAADPTCAWRVVVTDAGGQVIAVTRMRWPDRRRPDRWQRKSGHPPESGTQPPRADARQPGPGVPGPGVPGPGVPGPGVPGPGVPGPGVPGPGRNDPGVLGRITVTVPVMLLREPLPNNLSAPSKTPGSSESPSLISALQRILSAAAAAVREVGSDGDHDSRCAHANAAAGYRIPDRMRDLIEVRDQVCGFPICRRPASRCDLDHTVPYDQGGLTCPCNISGGCRHDHRMKGSTAWRLRQPRPGTLTWTAPSGLSWTVTPEPHAA